MSAVVHLAVQKIDQGRERQYLLLAQLQDQSCY